MDIACGSGDAQTLAVTDTGLVYSWGDGDYGKLGKSALISYYMPIYHEPLTHFNRYDSASYICSFSPPFADLKTTGHDSVTVSLNEFCGLMNICQA